MSREETGIYRRRELGPPRKPLFHAHKVLARLYEFTDGAYGRAMY